MTQASATYQAELIDRVTKPAQDIAKALNDLKVAFNDVKQPMEAVNKTFRNVSQSIKKTERAANTFASTLRAVQYGAFVAGNLIGQSMLQAARAFTTLSVASGAAATAMGAFVLASVNANAEMKEVESQFKAVYRDGFEEANNFAEAFASQMNKSTRATKQGLTQFQSLFLGLGIATKQGEKLSQVLTKIAADLAATGAGQPFEEMLERVLKGISGSPEILRTTGFAPMENQVKQFVADSGGTYKDMDEGQKTLARIAFIMQGMKRTNMIGQAAKESGNWVQQLDALKAGWESIKREFGEIALRKILPVLVSLAKATRGIADALGKLPDSAVGAFIGVAAALGMVSVAAAGAAASLFVLGSVALVMTGAFTGIIAITLAFQALATLVSGPVAIAFMVIAAAIAAQVVVIAGFVSALMTAGILGYGAEGSSPLVLILHRLEQFFNNLTTSVQLFANAIAVAIQANDWGLVWEIMVLSFNHAIRSIGMMMFDTLMLSMQAFINAAKQMLIDLSKTFAAGFSIGFGSIGAKMGSAIGGLAGGGKDAKSYRQALRELLEGKGVKPDDGFINEYIEKQRKELERILEILKRGFAGGGKEEEEVSGSSAQLDTSAFATTSSIVASKLANFVGRGETDVLLPELQRQTGVLKEIANGGTFN